MNLNPLSCEIYVYELLHHLLPSHFTSPIEATHIVIPQYIANQLPSFWLGSLTIVTLVIAFTGIAYKCFQVYSSKLYLNTLLKQAKKYKGEIDNQILVQELKRINVTILLSSRIDIPFATRSNLIVLPEKNSYHKKNLRQLLRMNYNI